MLLLSAVRQQNTDPFNPFVCDSACLLTYQPQSAVCREWAQCVLGDCIGLFGVIVDQLLVFSIIFASSCACDTSWHRFLTHTLRCGHYASFAG